MTPSDFHINKNRKVITKYANQNQVKIHKFTFHSRIKARDLTKICILFNCQLVASFRRKLLILHTFYLIIAEKNLFQKKKKKLSFMFLLKDYQLNLFQNR